MDLGNRKTFFIKTFNQCYFSPTPQASTLGRENKLQTETEYFEETVYTKMWGGAGEVHKGNLCTQRLNNLDEMNHFLGKQASLT